MFTNRRKMISKGWVGVVRGAMLDCQIGYCVVYVGNIFFL